MTNEEVYERITNVLKEQGSGMIQLELLSFFPTRSNT